MELIDNVNKLFIDELSSQLTSSSRLKIAASYFSIYAFDALKEELKNIDSLQFIFTEPTFTADIATEQKPKQSREFEIPKRDRENSIYGSEFEIHLRNKLTQRTIAKECADWIRQKAQFKSNMTNADMQKFLIAENSNKTTAYIPISGFTPIGLGLEKGNAISNIIIGHDENSITDQLLNLFNQIWYSKDKVEDITEEIIKHIEMVYAENSPQSIYFLILYNIFKDFLEDLEKDNLPNDKTGYQDTLIWKKLFNFQKDAAVGIINKLENYNGCILADSVGLGKTFTALAVIKYYELRNRSVLVLCPKKLSANWTTYNTNIVTNIFNQDRFNYDVLHHSDLSRTSGESNGINLSLVNWGNYDLVVIDESHNFRNKGWFRDRETRYDKLMNQIIKAGVKTKVLMLSATPVNNRFNDLKNQLALAYEGNAKQLENKLDIKHSIERIFKNAQASFNQWSKLPPKQRTTQAILNLLDFDFFKLLDSVTIARSRKHIQTFYDIQDIGNFPKRLAPISIQCGISKQHSISLNDLYNDLAKIKMSIYAPVNYILPSRLAKYEDKFDTQFNDGKKRFKQTDRERSLQNLMTTNLLKRLESSIEAFRLTLTSIEKNISATLSKVEKFNQNSTEYGLFSYMDYQGAEDRDLFEDENFIGREDIKIHLEDMDTLSWERDLKSDLLILQQLLNQIKPITADKDEKLQHLKQQIIHKINNPINENNRKVIIFTAFADTADYLYRHLADYFEQYYQLHSARITGSDNPKSTLKQSNNQKSYDMQGILTLFSPISKEKAKIFPQETREIDLLIATDCISEGQNLQDCDYLINYDIHWNPVRIIQRFGRIDRIGSPNKTIQLVNYWPNISLDEYINLRERVENRMVITDMTSTGDDNILTAKENDIAYRREQLKRLQTEVLDLEDTNTGVSISDLGLNDFRIDLFNYLEQHPNLKNKPNGLHTVVSANKQFGLEAGVLFVLKARNAKLKSDENNYLYPYFLIYINEQHEVILNPSQAKKQLDLIRKMCRHQDQPIESAYRPFNLKTKDGSEMQTYSALLASAVNEIQQHKAESDLDSLFSGFETTALEDDVQHLNDFELINFIVIQDS